jgi:hypothetical protein
MAMPKRVEPVKTIRKMIAPNEKRTVSDIYLLFWLESKNDPRARIDGTHTPT